MTEELLCAYCGKKLTKDSEDSDEITYTYDIDSGNVICLECFNYNKTLTYPEITFFPGGEKVWISQMFSGTNKFTAEWISDTKYRGHWNLYSDIYEKIDVEDLDGTVQDLKDKGKEFVIININKKTEIWIKK